jgi:hypothetical protein
MCLTDPLEVGLEFVGLVHPLLEPGVRPQSRQPKHATPASWLPIRRAWRHCGLRHGHETWLVDLGVQETLKSGRMGHEVPGMAGVYGHIMPQRRDKLRRQLHEPGEAALRERARLSPTRPWPSRQATCSRPGPPDRHLAPLGASGGSGSRVQTAKNAGQHALHGVSDGIRTHDTQDHNLVL